MEPALIPLLTVLMLMSSIFCAVFVMAWKTMGRPRHALTWAAAFALGTFAWAMNLAEGTLFTAGALYFVVSGVPLLGSLILAVVGYRQRNGLPARPLLLWTITAGVTLSSAACTISWQTTGMTVALIPLCATSMFPVAIHAIRERAGRRSSAEWASIGVLALFTLFESAITILALRIGNGHGATADAAYDLYAISLFSGLPSLYIGLGIAALFLLMADQTAALDRIARHDGMTQLLNRSGFREIAISSLRDRPSGCVVVADIDHFKRINDRWGHPVGDLVIIHTAEVLRRNLRADDVIGRIGGEEFAMLLPHLDRELAVTFVERLRFAVSQISVPGYPEIQMTMTFGIAILEKYGASLDEVLSLADGALYAAKSEGRDRIGIVG